MNLGHEELRALLRLVDITRPEEITCDEFLSRVAGYLERLGDSAIPPPGHEALLHHLRVCPECLEEFEALYEALFGAGPNLRGMNA